MHDDILKASKYFNNSKYVNLFTLLKNLWHSFYCFARLLIYNWGNWDSESISGSPKVRQLTSRVKPELSLRKTPAQPAQPLH